MGNSQWNDLLTNYNGFNITYDAIGNPIKYKSNREYYFTWTKGRQLETATNMDAVATYSYGYDANGIRTEKTVGNTVHKYVTQNGKVIRETIVSALTTGVLDFLYDNTGKPFALKYSTDGGSSFTTYYYVLNLQGDVVALMDKDGAVVARYSYSAWGEIRSVTDGNGAAITSASHIANLNPLRYRGYYYDTETGFYYLQSRYYDPITHRFINADTYSSTDSDNVLASNMFAYCQNNPVCSVDENGMLSELLPCIFPALEDVLKAMLLAVGCLFSATRKSAIKKTLTENVVAIREKEEAAAAVQAEADSQDPIYYGCTMKKNKMIYLTPPMDFKEAYSWAKSVGSIMGFSKKDVWGLYTVKSFDAYTMAAALNTVAEPIEHNADLRGHYDHWHPYGFRLPGDKANFHVWYGFPLA